MTTLLPRAALLDVLAGDAPLVGSRLDPALPRGLVSPVEARVNLGLPYGDLLDEEASRLADRTAAASLRALASAALTTALTAEGPAPRRPRIVSAAVDNLTVAEALDEIFAPPGDRVRVIHFVHPHALNLAHEDPQLRAQLDRAELVLPDGVGLRIAGLILGISLRDNLNGTDLLPLLCRRAVAEGRPLALVGAAPGVAEACALRLQADFPGLSIPVVSHGFLDDEASARVAARIAALDRPLTLVAMGTPLQESWIWKNIAPLPGVTALSVGGLFDFFAGRVPRAPWLWRELGLEWLFRLRCEPRRLARRYLVGNPLFLLRALRQRAAPSAP